jgi:Fuc2NAc and GlcNAc transferase
VKAFLLLLGTVVVSAAVVGIVRGFATRRALLDHPNDRSSHSVPKPRLGGIGVILPTLAVGMGLVFTGRAPAALLLPLAATGCIALVGLVDDLRPLSARARFGVQAVLASIVVAASWSRLPAAAGLLGEWLPASFLAPLAVLWIVWLTNLYNFMDGIDGIAGCQALIAALGLAAVAMGSGASATAWLLLALAGSSTGFLLFNFPPASIFMGDVGSTSIGFLFAILPFLPEARPIAIEPVALALSFFVVDATFTLLRRVAAGERWHAPHRTHLYQRPVVLGLEHRAVLGATVGAMLVGAACAVAWPSVGTGARLVLATIPLLLYGGGHVLVARMASRSRA